MPPRKDQLEQFSHKIGLSTTNVYKWFWDITKKRSEEYKLAQSFLQDNTNGEEKAEPIQVAGVDGRGQGLSP